MRRTVIILALVAGMLLVPTAARAESFRSDSTAYNGSFSALGFYSTGNSRLSKIYDMRAVVELPRRYRNGFCAYARVGVNGVFKLQSYRDCDTNGDATLTLFIRGPIYASHGDRVEVWFSDPVTRYVITHPSIRL
jgi:hypothetical protein